MKKKSIVVLLLLSIVVSATAFQLLDPRLTSSTTPQEVDFSAPPSEIVFVAVTNLDQTDYTYTVVSSPSQSGASTKEDLIKRLKVENSDQQYIAYGPFGTNGTKIYGNDAVAWARPPDSDWQINLQKRYAYPAENDLNPFNSSKIADTEGKIIDETSTEVAIRVNATTVKGTDLDGYTLFYLDKRTKHVQRAVEVTHYDGNTSSVVVRFDDVGTTTVERPPGIGVSPLEVVVDVLRYNSQ